MSRLYLVADIFNHYKEVIQS